MSSRRKLHTIIVVCLLSSIAMEWLFAPALAVASEFSEVGHSLYLSLQHGDVHAVLAEPGHDEGVGHDLNHGENGDLLYHNTDFHHQHGVHLTKTQGTIVQAISIPPPSLCLIASSYRPLAVGSLLSAFPFSWVVPEDYRPPANLPRTVILLI